MIECLIDQHGDTVHLSEALLALSVADPEAFVEGARRVLAADVAGTCPGRVRIEMQGEDLVVHGRTQSHRIRIAPPTANGERG